MNTEFAIVSFVRFKRRNGGGYLPYCYQNFYLNEQREYDGVVFDFAPFAVSAGGGKRGGERNRGAWVIPSNTIATAIAFQADDERWLMEVSSVEVDTETDETMGLIQRDLWSVRLETSLERDKPTMVTLALSSPLDTTTSLFGGRPLTSKRVGSLPTSGSITIA